MACPVYDAATVAQLLGIQYSEEELAAFGDPPDPLEGYLTFFDPGQSILQLQPKVTDMGMFFRPQCWYDREPFAQLEEQPHYRQLRMEAVEGSFGKTFTEQQALLPTMEEVPLVRVVVKGMVLHFLGTEQRLFSTSWVRCADTDSGGYRVFVGCSGSGGIFVRSRWDDNRYDILGLASSRKS